jgi:hypothetical protein
MKKITSREFQKAFGKVSANLKPGQSVLITHHGKPVGAFTKSPIRKIPCPNFLANLEKAGADEKAGASLLKNFYDDCLL